MTERDVRRVARERFGWDRLRPGQFEAIDAAVSGRDVLAVMPTGYGKSAIYQLAAVFIPGPTVVVSPLIALQVDQLTHLAAAADAPDAVAVNSAQADGVNEDAWESISTQDAEYVFLAPEQLAKDDVVDRLCAAGVGLFVVDEAHCVSSWGHDFRPDYLRLGEVIRRLGRPVTIALTATGSPPIREEIVDRLGMRDVLQVGHGFDRPNLRLEVIRHSEDADKRQAVVEQVLGLPKPGLVYVSTRQDTAGYAEDLAGHGLTAAAYHAGLRASERKETHRAFLTGELEVVVATSAFGMGIDKPNLRFVVHAAITESLDAYYQEIGRGGRDGAPALATLHYRAEDLGLRSFFTARTADRDELVRAYSTLAATTTGTNAAPLRVSELGRRLGLSTRRTAGLVNLLDEAGVLKTTRRGIRATGPADATGPVDASEAADRAVQAAESRERIEQSRLAMMRSYAETTSCRRQYLLGYFGEELRQPCGNCDTCTSGSAAEADAGAPAPDDGFAAETAVRHREWGKGVVMSSEDDRITVFFEDQGYKVLSRELIREHDLLTAE